MRTTVAVIAASFALLAAGCGSSGPATSSSRATTTTSSGSQLKVTGTPKYGQPAASSPVQSGTVQIAYRDIAIDPDAVRVRVGTLIRWTNYDTVEHNVTSEGGPQRFASKDFGERGTFSIRALKPGIIHYQCTIHPASMNGTIEVLK